MIWFCWYEKCVLLSHFLFQLKEKKKQAKKEGKNKIEEEEDPDKVELKANSGAGREIWWSQIQVPL